MRPTSKQSRGGEQPERSTILVVEDEILVRLLIVGYLREFGFKVVEAGNAAEATRILCSDEAVEVVFSDIRMPGEMNGIALANWIGRNKPHVGVVLTSGHARLADLAADACDAADFIAKPYMPQTVLERIEAQLDRVA
jgi:two-component system, response regulator PdtaR